MKKRAKRKPKSLKRIVFLALAILAGAGGYSVFAVRQDNKLPQKDSSVIAQNIPEPAAKTGTLKTFSGTQFKELYDNFAYPNTQIINEDTPITGDHDADAHIRALAVKRGYKLRSAPVTDVFREVEPDMKLQERAAQPWLDMKSAAEKDGIAISLIAAYRSADEQKEIFLSRLSAVHIPVQKIASGTYDAQLDQLLQMTAVPGYSRHHTGYTIDITCPGQNNVFFQNTTCFKWLSSENYKNTKRFGWIPSYPDGTNNQGPDPEAWEYVWVGTDTLTE